MVGKKINFLFSDLSKCYVAMVEKLVEELGNRIVHNTESQVFKILRMVDTWVHVPGVIVDEKLCLRLRTLALGIFTSLVPWFLQQLTEKNSHTHFM